jgi:predicted enzyme related to lactoylglutathione lyase
MGIKLAQVTFDCADPPGLARFWSGVVGGSVAEGANQHVALVPGGEGVPTMLFLRVPEAKTAKNRVHLDLGTPDLEAETARVLALGATHVHDKQEWGVTWATFLDPEGNEFCVGLHPELFE